MSKNPNTKTTREAVQSAEVAAVSNVSAAQSAEQLAELRLLELKKRQQEELENRTTKQREAEVSGDLASDEGRDGAEEEQLLSEEELPLDIASNSEGVEFDAVPGPVEEVAWLDNTWLSSASEADVHSAVELANASTVSSSASGVSVVSETAQYTPSVFGGWGLPLGVIGVVGAGIGAAVGLGGGGGSSAAAAGGSALKVLTGTAIDGYLQNATVFLDANGNGQLDNGEASTTTDANGKYSLSTNDTGNIVVVGGTNTDTGLANNFTIVVDSSASVISPVNAVATALVSLRSGDADGTNDITFAEALEIVGDFFLLPDEVDLASYDYMSTAVTESATYAVNVVLALMESYANDKGEDFAESVAIAIDAILSGTAPSTTEDAINELLSELSGQTAQSGSSHVLSDTTELPSSTGTQTLSDVVSSIASKAAGEDKAAISQQLKENGWTAKAEDANADGVTNASDNADGLVISGTGVAGATVTLTTPDNVAQTSVTVDANGRWSVTLTGVGSDGVIEGINTVSVTQVAEVDDDSTVTSSVDFSFTVDTEVGRAISFDDSSTINANGVDNYEITLTGSETVTMTVEVRDANGNIVQQNNDAGEATYTTSGILSGQNAVLPSSLLSNLDDGSYTLWVSITDAAGNTVSSSQNIVLDTNVTGITVDSYDTLLSQEEAASAFAISGSVNTSEIAVGETITVTFTGTSGGAAQNLTATATVQSDGTWSTTRNLGSFDDGTISISVSATDVNGNTGGPAGYTVTVDRTVSDPTVSTDLSGVIESSDLTSGVLALAGTLSDEDIVSVTVTLVGSAPNSSSTEVYTNTITATVNGTDWSVNIDTNSLTYYLSSDDSVANIDALGDGQVSLLILVTDAAGNQTAYGPDFDIELTNTAPTVSADIADLNVQTSAAAGTELYDLVSNNAFSDADTSGTSNATLTYSLQMADGSTVPSWLTITSDGKLAVATGQTAPSTDTSSSLVVRVVATDGAGASVYQDVNVNVVSSWVPTSVEFYDTSEVAVTTLTENTSYYVVITAPSGVDGLDNVGTSATATFDINGQEYTATIVTDYSGELGSSDSTVFVLTLPTGVAEGGNVTLVSIDYGAANPTLDGAPVAETINMDVDDVIIDYSTPVFEEDTYSFSISEGGSGLLGTVAATDANGITYSLLEGVIVDNNGYPLFEIDQDGNISVKDGASIDYESVDGTYNLVVTATDAAGLISYREVTVNVTDVNEAPTVAYDFDDAAVQVSASAGAEIFDVDGYFEDPDSSTTANGTLTYTLTAVDGSAAPSWLTISSDGVISVATGQTAPSTVTSTSDPIVVRVVATDGAGVSVTQDLEIDVVAGWTPTSIYLPYGETVVSEGDTLQIGVAYDNSMSVTLAGDSSGYPTATFNINGQTVTGTWVAFGTGAMTFSVTVPTNATGTEISLVSLDPNESTMTLNGMTIDTGFDAVSLSGLTVDDGDPTFDQTTYSVDENSTGVVATLQVSDYASVTYSIGTIEGWSGVATTLDSDLFTVNDQGQISLKDGASIDYETYNAYFISVTATDAYGNSTEQSIDLTINDVNEAPIASDISDLSAYSNQAFSTSIASYFTDVDDGDSLTFSASGLPDGLSIASNGTISGTPSAAGTSTVTITATDSGGLTVTQDVDISISAGLSLSTAVQGVTNLDVRSDLVVSGSENVAFTDQAGTYTITLTDGTASGYRGETQNNTQIFTITVDGSGDISSVSVSGDNGSTSTSVDLADVLSIDGDKLTLNPAYDLDLSSNYTLTISDGLLVGADSGTSSALSATFSTVTPKSGTTDASQAAASQIMTSAGGLEDSSDWLDISNLGDATLTLGQSVSSDASVGSIVYVLQDASSDAGTESSDGIVVNGSGNIALTSFGTDDLLYFDNIFNGTTNDLSQSTFAGGVGNMDGTTLGNALGWEGSATGTPPSQKVAIVLEDGPVSSPFLADIVNELGFDNGMVISA
ncbi:hypothetical protein ABIE64_002175 [Thalassospira sp. MBR-102]|uniref:beta strand repeat-containing protein n=1 Tax=Thalassospira sp. MBR-102 TaxID=3156466 RepID=UPI0033998C4F